jgi:uncharacterized membrane protein YdbT with pleckstrin-like domain
MNDNNNLFRLHWIIFLKPILVLLIPLIITYLGFFNLAALCIFMAVCAVLLVAELVNYSFTWMRIKNNSVTLQTGFVVQQTIEIPFKKIESVDIRQTLLGTVLNYGDIIIVGSGGSRNFMNCVANPITCRRYIEQYLHAA